MDSAETVAFKMAIDLRCAVHTSLMLVHEGRQSDVWRSLKSTWLDQLPRPIGSPWQAEGAQNEPFAVLAWRNNRECSRMISDPGAMQGDCLTVSGPLRMLASAAATFRDSGGRRRVYP